ncbi:MAG: hypothetical protein AAFY84_03700 [Pseudomonadota bacterium]
MVLLRKFSQVTTNRFSADRFRNLLCHLGLAAALLCHAPTAAYAMTPEAPLAPAYLEADSDPDRFGEQNGRYVDCITLVADDLEIGRIGAQQWVAEGGGDAAQHCLAVADLAAGFPKLAAIRLTEIAENVPSAPPEIDAGAAPIEERKTVQATLYAEAALAWIDADAVEDARSSVLKALETAPALADLQIIAAKVFVANEEWQAVVDAIKTAKAAGFVTAEGFVMSARAHRALAKDLDAAQDIVAALKLDPFNLDALVLRGELIQAGIEINTKYTPVEDADDVLTVD